MRRRPEMKTGTLERLIPPVIALLLALVVAIPFTETTEAPVSTGRRDRADQRRKGRGGTEGGRRVHPRSRVQPPGRQPLLRRPRHRRRRVAHPRLCCAWRGETSQPWLGLLVGVLRGDRAADLDPEKAYLLVMVADVVGGHTQALHALILVHRPMGLWDRMLRAFSPETRARAIATWVVGGVHGTL